MADISSIKTPDGTVYSIKDSTARQRVLPDVTAADDGKILRVVSGEWTSYSLIKSDITSLGIAPTANPEFTGKISMGRISGYGSGENSVAIGYNLIASGDYAFAEGAGTVSNGRASHAEGSASKASANVAHAEGQSTLANGAYSHVGGMYNVPDSYDDLPAWVSGTSYEVGDKVKRTLDQTYAYICKTANSDTTFTSSHWISLNGKMNYAEIIGNGTDDNARSNARVLDWEGNERIAGDMYVGCNPDSTGGTKVATVSDVSGLIDDSTTSQTKVWSSNKVSGLILPAVSSTDDGKYLKVVNGSWAVATGEGGGGGDVSSITMNGTSYTPVNGVVDLGAVITSHQDISGLVSSVTMNGSSISPANGVIDLGTVITSHQDISGLAPKSHATNATTYGGATASNYGHVRLSDTYTTVGSNGKAANSVGASAWAVQSVYNDLTSFSAVTGDNIGTLNASTKLDVGTRIMYKIGKLIILSMNFAIKDNQSITTSTKLFTVASGYRPSSEVLAVASVYDRNGNVGAKSSIARMTSAGAIYETLSDSWTSGSLGLTFIYPIA